LILLDTGVLSAVLFPIVHATEDDHEEAAKLVNGAARRGVAVSATDALIAAQAVRLGAILFTVDPDFARISPAAGLRLVPA